MKELYTEIGRRRIRVPPEAVGAGGEGSVYLLRAGEAMKVFHGYDPDRVTKLREMLRFPPDDPTKEQGHRTIAWPTDLLLDAGNNCVGYTMPSVQEAYSLRTLVVPKLREKRARGINWLHLHTVALNLASAFAVLHDRNYVVGDVKPDNILVSRNSLVSLVDVDSFQVVEEATGRVFRCPVGSEGYTPPELVGRAFGEVDRDPNHDAFGLAVLIHTLLLEGVHPYHGEWTGQGVPPPVDELIRAGQWPHAPNSRLRPGRWSISLRALHSDVRDCFVRCFIDGQTSRCVRPTAADWHSALRASREALVQCNRNSQHYYVGSSVACTWCERSRDLKRDSFPVLAVGAANQRGLRAALPKQPRPPSAPIVSRTRGTPAALLVALGLLTLGIVTFFGVLASSGGARRGSDDSPSVRSKSVPSRGPVLGESSRARGLLAPAHEHQVVVHFHAYPWAAVTIDGRTIATETPATLQLPPGRYKVDLTSPTGAKLSKEVTLRKGGNYVVRGLFTTGQMLIEDQE